MSKHGPVHAWLERLRESIQATRPMLANDRFVSFAIQVAKLADGKRAVRLGSRYLREHWFGPDNLGPQDGTRVDRGSPSNCKPTKLVCIARIREKWQMHSAGKAA